MKKLLLLLVLIPCLGLAEGIPTKSDCDALKAQLTEALKHSQENKDAALRGIVLETQYANACILTGVEKE